MIVTDLINVSDPKTVTAFLETLVVPAEHIEPLLIDILSSNASSIAAKFIATNYVMVNDHIIHLLNRKGLLGKLLQHGPLKFDLQNMPIVLINAIGPETNQDNLYELMKISLINGCPTMFQETLKHYTGNIDNVLQDVGLNTDPHNLITCFAKISDTPIIKKLEIAESMFKYNYNALVVKAFTNHLGIFREFGPEQYYKFYGLTNNPDLMELVLKYCRDEFDKDTLRTYKNKVMSQLEFMQKMYD